MAFRVGNKHGRGGRRPGAGRPTKEQTAQKETLRQAIERKREEKAAALAKRNVEMGEKDPPTMRHLVDKVMPDLDETSPAPQAITFIQFNNPPQLPAKEVSVAIEHLAPKENRLPESQGQDGVKFLDFTKKRLR